MFHIKAHKERASLLAIPISIAALPEHEIHKLKPLPSQEAVSIGWQHEAGTQSIEEVLHHLLLLSCGRVVTFEHLKWKDNERERLEGGHFEKKTKQKPRQACYL